VGKFMGGKGGDVIENVAVDNLVRDFAALAFSGVTRSLIG